MYNWNINIEKLKKYSEKYTIWRLEQSINFGLNRTKLKTEEVKKYWNKLSLDSQRKKLLEMWLWPKQS